MTASTWHASLRRTDAYRRFRGHVVRRLRKSAVLNRVVTATAVPARRINHKRRIIPFPAGTAFPPGHGTTLPLVVVSFLGFEEKDVAVLATRLHECQLTTPGFRICLILDRPAFATLRTYGYMSEVLMPEAEWIRLHPTEPWCDYVESNVRRVSKSFGSSGIVPFMQPMDVARLEPAVLRAVISATISL